VLTLPLHANNYVIDVATTTLIYVILALGLNLVVGQTGLLHLGYVAFYGIGAYTYALLSTGVHASFWIGLPAAMFAAAIFGLVLGFPVLRLRGDYLAIVTLGFGEVTRLVLRNWDEVTNGPNGILGIARPSLGGWVLDTPASFYYLVLVLALLALFAMRRIFQSRIGRAWVAIREDELAARTIGIDVARYKLLAFALGAAVAGLGGSVFAAKMTFVSPESFTFFESVIILCMVVLGGMGSLPGVVLGAAVITILPELLRGVSDYRMLIFGAAMVLLMVFRPQGLIGSRSLAYEFRRPRRR
jgi:branched-chain amino acid transport system permease protein